jgi:periplasmic protein TonB
MSTAFEVERRQQTTGISPKPPGVKIPPQAGPPLHLFEDVLLSQTGVDRKRRTASAVISITLECLLVAAVVIIPMMFTDVLPAQQLVTFLIAPPPPPPPPPPPQAAAAVRALPIQTNIIQGELRTPTRIPQKVEILKEGAAPPMLGGVEGGVVGGIPGGTMGGVIGGIISSTPAILPKITPPKVLRVSQGVSRGLLIRRVDPVYPLIAKQARIQGEVVLKAIISKDGTIENLQVESGHPLLTGAAVDAVKQWRFRPFLLNGEPIEIETVINVDFVLSQ